MYDRNWVTSFAIVVAVAVHVVTYAGAGLPAGFRVSEFVLLSIGIGLAAGERGNRSEPASPAPGARMQG